MAEIFAIVVLGLALLGAYGLLQQFRMWHWRRKHVRKFR